MNTKLTRHLCFAALLASFAFTPIALPEAKAETRISIGANIGFRLPKGAVNVSVGDHRYHYHEGRYYRKTPRGYVTVRAPRGAAIKRLPHGYTRVIIGGRTYFRHENVYYVRSSNRYIVVDEPKVVVVETEAESSEVVAVEKQNAPYTVWIDGERELVMKNGQFFRNSPQGLVWVALPVGAIAKELPSDFTSIWYQEIEYYEKDGVHFQKTPDGYRIILPPWETKY
ncbi:DUF6515 family protein [Pelagicoccus enzymogenes]|uniref:DUF6515 family protein n=1 Tax=Pelagicoccus enzymogenes TaxID=2773457 RepID=UPI00280D4B4F|nr:DUF6515 family protein [Pelagicoccus enzymogenes]MDQ8197997.1 DUF6515 family protein [Pelagicoccus enzymogenes]